MSGRRHRSPGPKEKQKVKHSLEREEIIGAFRITMRYEPWFEMSLARGIPRAKADHKWVIEVKFRQRQSSTDYFPATREQKDRLECRVPHQRRIDAIKVWDEKRRELCIEVAMTALQP